MRKIGPTEYRITGKWEIVDGVVKANDDCIRIADLIKNCLVEVARDSSGWDVLFKDSDSSRFWELVYPESSVHGGGPPELRCLSEDEVKAKYGVDVV